MAVDDLTKRKTEKLAQLGYQLLEDGDAEAALKVAAELEALRYTATFEIAALAHARLGDLEAAVAVLKRGLEIAPKVWINWQLLGNYLSDLEHYEEAASAFERAWNCPDVDQSSIRLNQAILASRRGLNDQALSYAEQVTDPDLALRTASARVTALAGLGRFDEALRIGEAILTTVDPDEPEELAYLAASMGSARLGRGTPAEEVIAFAVDALDQYDRSNTQLLALIRDADNQRSAAAKYYRLTVDAKIPFTDPLSQLGQGYIVNYDVVADSVDEALPFIERMEAPTLRGLLVVDEHEILEHRPDDPKGVYARTPRHYYARED
jgi:tetratricopeptide (TPR) repeat protein